MDDTKSPGGAPNIDGDPLELARQRLADFEASASTSDLIARLRAASPLHPFLLVRTVAGVLTALCAIATLASLAVPLLGRDFTERLLALDAASGIPVPAAFGIVTVCATVVLFAAHFAAAAAGRSAPYRPHEAKVHQRLTSDVRQLEAQKAVKQRMTPAGAGPRVLAR
jgi:hypothetical protein